MDWAYEQAEAEFEAGDVEMLQAALCQVEVPEDSQLKWFEDLIELVGNVTSTDKAFCAQLQFIANTVPEAYAYAMADACEFVIQERVNELVSNAERALADGRPDDSHYFLEN